MAWTNVANASQSWTTEASSAFTWTSTQNVSAESRLNRVFPQPEDPNHTPGEIDFIWQVRTDGWYVATGNNVQIKSSITEGV